MYRHGGRSVNLGGINRKSYNWTVFASKSVKIWRGLGGNCPPPCSAGPDVHVEKLSEIVGTDSRGRAVGRSENLGGRAEIEGLSI